MSTFAESPSLTLSSVIFNVVATLSARASLSNNSATPGGIITENLRIVSVERSLLNTLPSLLPEGLVQS